MIIEIVPDHKRLKTDYLDAFDHKKRQVAIDKCISILKAFSEDVGLVFTGLSGQLIGIPLAHTTNRPFAIVRQVPSYHSCLKVEGYIHVSQYIIIDDFIESGKTIKTIIKEMTKASPKAKCIGILLYEERLEDKSSHVQYHDDSIPFLRLTK